MDHFSNQNSDPIARNPKDVKGSNGNEKSLMERHLDRICDNNIQVQARQERALAPVASQGETLGLGPVPPFGPSASPRSMSRSPLQMMAAFFRYKWSIIFVTVLVACPLITYIWTRIVPEYRARAEIRICPIIRYLVFETAESGPIPFYESFVNTQVSVIRSITVLQRVLDQNEVQATRWYREPPISLLQRVLDQPAAPPLERLRKSLNVNPRRRTEIVDISFSDKNASEAVAVLDTVVNEYLKFVGQKTGDDSSQMFQQLSDQYKALKNEITGRERVTSEFKRQLGTENPEGLISQKRLRIDELEATLSRLQQSISILEWKKQHAEEAAEEVNDVPIVSGTEEKKPQYFEDSEWRELSRNVKSIEYQLSITDYASSHPKIKKIQSDLEFARERLTEREQQLDYQWENRVRNVPGVPRLLSQQQTSTDPITGLPNANLPASTELGAGLTEVEQQLVQAEQEKKLLETELTQQQQEFQGLFDTAQLLTREQQTLAHKMEIFDAVRERLEQKRMERSMNAAGSIEVLTQAFSPSKPSKDRRIIFTVMVLFLSLGLGFGMALLRILRNQSISSISEMTQVARTPFLGCLPLVPQGWSPDCDESPLMIESVRALRTQLLVSLGEISCPKLLITSANAGTGKTSFTMILAKSLARAGKRVLVVDADFYCRMLSRRCKLLDRPGFLDSMRNQCFDPRHIYESSTENLSILPSGQQVDEGEIVEDIANGTFKKWCTQIDNSFRFDIVLLDSPPILPVADALILAGQVDGAIMVERENISQRASVQTAQVRLQSNGGHLVGAVFIGSLEAKKNGYGYGYSYGYTSDPHDSDKRDGEPARLQRRRKRSKPSVGST